MAVVIGARPNGLKEWTLNPDWESCMVPEPIVSPIEFDCGGGDDMAKISTIRTCLFEVPLPEVLVDAKHPAHSHFELVTVSITLEDGTEGTGYTYTGGKGGRAIKAMLDFDLAPDLIGRSGEDVEAINEFCEWRIHYVGRGGVAAFAISAKGFPSKDNP